MSAHKLIVSVDPGQSGAIAFIADGVPERVVDMPVKPRQAGGFFVDSFALAQILRDGMSLHPAAYRMGVMEHVQAMPKMAANSMFRFGESYGVARGVMGALGLGYTAIRPQQWKGHFSLLKQEKDATRVLMLERWPHMADRLKLKKHDGRADAIALGCYAHEVELVL